MNIKALSLLVILSFYSFALAHAQSNKNAGQRSLTRVKLQKNKSEEPRGNTRVMHFPARSIGGLYLTHLTDDCLLDTKEITVARGDVRINVPADRCLMLRPNGALITDPRAIADLPANALDIIEIAATPLDEVEDTSGDEVLKYVARQISLKQLFMQQFFATDSGLSSLVTLKKLQHLKSEVGKAEGTSLKTLATLPELFDLNLSFNPIKQENFKYLEKFPKLKRLILHHCEVDEKGASYIAKCVTIDDLSLRQNARVKDSCIPPLLKLKNLRTLDLRLTGVTFQGLKQLRALDKLRYLDISESALSQPQLAEIARLMPHLAVHLEARAGKVDDDTRRIFAPLPGSRI